MNHVELVNNYPTVRVEVLLSSGILQYSQSTLRGKAILKVTSNGVYISIGGLGLTRGEDVMYPEEKYKGKLVPYKYATNFKTIDIAIQEYSKWEEEFTSPYQGGL